MKYLREIGHIITKAGIKKYTFFTAEDLRNPDDQGARFLDFIVRNPVQQDQDAITQFYRSPNSKNGYGMMKARARSRMLETLSHLNLRTPEYSEETVALYKVNKYLFWSRTLLTLGGRNTAIQLAEQGLEMAAHFQFTQSEVDFLNILKHHASLIGDSKLFMERCSSANAKLHILLSEYQMIEIFEHLQCQFTKSNVLSAEEEAFIRQAIQKATDPVKGDPSHVLMLNRFRVRVLCHQLLREFRQGFDSAVEAHEYLLSYRSVSSSFRMGEFAIYRLKCALYLRDFEAGRVAAEECAQHLPVGSNNWFYFMEDFFLLSMLTTNIEEAAKQLQLATQHARFELLPSARREKWKVFEMYLNQARRMFGHVAVEELRQGGDLPLDSLLQSVPTYKKDKYGYNISLLILQILKLIESREFSEVVARMEALSTYRARYLAKNDQHQTALFFKLLRIMVSTDFDFSETKRKGDKYAAMFTEIAPDQTEIEEGMQILPYDLLWRWVMEQLKEVGEERSLTIRPARVNEGTISLLPA